MTGRPTWLSPLASAWYRVYPRSEVPWGPLARCCRPLVEKHPAAEVAGQLEVYLRQVGPNFISLPKFAACFGSWGVAAPAKRLVLSRGPLGPGHWIDPERIRPAEAREP